MKNRNQKHALYTVQQRSNKPKIQEYLNKHATLCLKH